MFDVVNLDKNVQQELSEEIKQDGVILYDVMTLTGSVALFEICFEQSWKAE